MIHKIGNFNDTLSLPPMTQAIKSLILSNVNLLCQHYGDNRDTDNDDGGIILYCPKGTAEDELKKHFDYTRHLPEYVEVIEGVCHALYITTNEYTVSVIMSIVDLPQEIKEELK